MKINREFTSIAVLLFIVGLFWAFNNILEFYFISERKASSLFTATIFYCVFYYALILFIKRKYVYNDKRIVIKHLLVFFIPYIVLSIALYMFVGLNTWTRIIIILSGLIIACFLLFKSLKKKPT